MSSSEDENSQPLAQKRDSLYSNEQNRVSSDELELDTLPSAPHSVQDADSPSQQFKSFEQVPKPSNSDENASDSDPLDPFRPNRYNGPPSTWLQWTAPERDIAKSLEQIKAKDLSIHLYNSYGLRRRARALRKQLDIDVRQAKSIWEPPKNWAAWPMPAADVPRQVHKNSNDPLDETSFTILPEDNSRKDLEELLLATLTRIARERFLSRAWDLPRERTRYEKALEELMWRMYRIAPSSGLNEYSQAAAISRQLSPPSRSRSISEYQTSETSKAPSSSEVSADQGFGQSDEESSAVNPVTSEDDNTDISQTTSQQTNLAQAKDVEPGPLVDDALARKIALPSIRHIISSLEVLLKGLHDSRLRYTVRDPERISKIRRSSTRKPRSRKRANSASKRDISNRKSSERNEIAVDSGSSQSEYIETDETSDDPGSDGPKPQRRQKRKRSGTPAEDRREGLRDWTDVLGIAAVQGWNAEVVERARLRCSALFGERMNMTTLGFNSFKSPDTGLRGAAPGMATADTSSAEEIEGGVHVDGFLRPITKHKSLRSRNRKRENERQRQKSRSRGRTQKQASEIGQSEAAEDEIMDWES